MKCNCTEKVSLLIDGELPAAEAREVERHLTVCAECQQLRADFLSLRSQLTAYSPSLEPADGRAALAKVSSHGGVSSGRSAPIEGSRRRFQLDLGWGFQSSLAAVALLIVVGFVALVVYRGSHRKSTAPAREVATGKRPIISPPPDQPKSPTPSASPETSDSLKTNTAKVPRRDNGLDFRLANARAASQRRREVTQEELGDRNNVDTTTVQVHSADTQTMTALHFEKSELLLRAFRNVRFTANGVSAEIGYEKNRAQQLVYQNIMLRREADTDGDVQVATLLDSLEPILLDIANLPAHPRNEDVRAIQQRVERKNIVALLQVNSTALARALD